MSNLIKENNIFEEVEKRCQSFIESDPLINAYRKKEWEGYFHKAELLTEREEGKLEGIKERNYTIAKDMKSKNMDINLISEITGLSVEEIRNLRPDGEKL